MAKDRSTIEDELQSRAKSDSDADEMFHQYKATRAYLEKEFYPWIQINCPYYTDHGELHIKSVINAIDIILESLIPAKKQQLSTLDLFLLLGGVLWHDVGNVFGRANHAERAILMTEQVKKLAFPNPNIQRLVSEIAVAHAGEQGLSKARPREDVSTKLKNYTVHTSALAAIVRYADEVSENQSRISQGLLDHVPPTNKIYWDYANSVAASVCDPARRLTRVTMNIPIQKATEEYAIVDGYADSCLRNYRQLFGKSSISLIEYCILRIEKMNNERAYCLPSFSRYVEIKEIELTLTLTNQNTRMESHEQTMTFGEGGLKQSNYPKIDVFNQFFQDHSEWAPDQLRKLI